MLFLLEEGFVLLDYVLSEFVSGSGVGGQGGDGFRLRFGVGLGLMEGY